MRSVPVTTAALELTPPHARSSPAPAGEAVGHVHAALLAQSCFLQAARTPGEIVTGQ